MATVTIEKESDNYVHFRLGNKPEFLCVMDRDKFEELVQGKTWWYLKVNSKGYKPYIARGIKGYTNRGNKTCRTHFLHWDVVGKVCTKATGLVCDHANRMTLDNTRENLNVTTYLKNVLNTERCENSLGRKYNLPESFTLAYIKKRSYYQCYFKQAYVASGKNLELVLEKINKYIENQSEVIHGQ